MSLRGLDDVYIMYGVDKMSTLDWNPLLLAVCYKHIDIVKYLTKELGVALDIFGRLSTC